MKNLILSTKQRFFILLTLFLLLVQFFLPYKSNASSNIDDGVISIHLIGDHDSDRYWFGQCLIPLKINAYMESGNHIGSIPVEKSWISGYNSEKLGKQTVTITYGGKTTTFTVTVVDYLKDIDIVGLKQNYKVGETLDLSGVSITEITASGIRITGKPITSNMISGFSTNTPGTKKLTINYHKNELGEDIKLSTFITVSESSTTYKDSVSAQTSNTNILDVPNQTRQSISSNNYNKTNVENNETIDSSENTEIKLNDILKNLFEISETKFSEGAVNPVKLFILVFTNLLLFI